MTATETFFSAPSKGWLPAAVPIVEDAECIGVMASTFDIRQHSEASAVTFGVSWRQRATAALYACAATHEAVEASELHPT